MDAELTDTSLTIRREFAHPPEVVFDAWIQPALVARWFAPPPMTAEVQSLEATQGGSYRIDMVAPDGTVMPVTGAYELIDRPTRLVFGWDWGEVSEAPSRVDVRFEPSERGTRLVLEHTRMAPPAVEPHADGWDGCLAALGAALDG